MNDLLGSHFPDQVMRTQKLSYDLQGESIAEQGSV